MKNFIIEYFKNNEYGNRIVREVEIRSSSMKDAIYVFRSEIGSLKYYTINYIQEINQNRKRIGDKVVPYKTNENADFEFKKINKD